MPAVGQRCCHYIRYILDIDERFTHLARWQRDFACENVIKKGSLGEILHEPAGTDDRRDYAICLAEPVMRDIWSGTQDDKTLRELELADSRACAETLAHIWQRLRPDAAPDERASTAFFIWQLGEATMRLAVSVDRAEGDRLVEIYRRMARKELSGGQASELHARAAEKPL